MAAQAARSGRTATVCYWQQFAQGQQQGVRWLVAKGCSSGCLSGRSCSVVAMQAGSTMQEQEAAVARHSQRQFARRRRERVGKEEKLHLSCWGG